MSFLKIAWRSVQRRWLASLLTMISMALGVALVVSVLLIMGVVSESFRSNSSLGYNMIVGAKGGKLQLVMNTVYHLSQPVENVPYSFYESFLPPLTEQDQGEDDSLDSDPAPLTGFTGPINLGEANAQHISAGLRTSYDLSDSEEAKALLGPLTTLDVSPQSIGGVVFRDLDLDGIHGAREPRVPNVAVKLWIDKLPAEKPDGKPDTEVAATQTGADGSYLFEGVEAGRPHFVQFVVRQPEFSQLTEFAIPLCMGDFFMEFRVVGTTPQMFEDFVFDAQKGRRYEFSEGRNLKTWSPEYGYFEAVLGAKVAKASGLKLGDTFLASHGVVDGAKHPDSFHVVGILKSTGTPNDRAAFVNMEGFYLLDDHAKPIPTGANANLVACVPQPDESQADKSVLGERHRKMKPLPYAQREVTSVLVRTINSLVSRGMQNSINEGENAQAVMPIAEIHDLFDKIVTPIQSVLLLITVMICVVSGVSILVSIYNSMNDRKQEIAIMRALGAGRGAVMSIVLLESVLLSLIGGLSGWVAAHLMIGGLASPFVEDRTGVSIGIFDIAPAVKPFEYLGDSPIMDWGISSEFLLIPGLLLLAIMVGFLPALAAYRTDVARALG